MSVLRLIARNLVFSKANKLSRDVLASYGIEGTGNVFDDNIFHSSIVLQNGTPGFEYARKDISGHIRFAGALLTCRPSSP